MMILTDREIGELKDQLKEVRTQLSDLTSIRGVEEERHQTNTKVQAHIGIQLDKLTTCMVEIKSLLLKSYLTRDEFADVMKETEKKLVRIHSRLDNSPEESKTMSFLLDLIKVLLAVVIILVGGKATGLL